MYHRKPYSSSHGQNTGSLTTLGSKPREGNAIRQGDVSTAWDVRRTVVLPLNIGSNNKRSMEYEHALSSWTASSGTKGRQTSLTLPCKWGTELEYPQTTVSEGGGPSLQPDSLELLEPER